MKKKGILLVLISTIIVALGQFFLKLGTDKGLSSLYLILSNSPLIIGVMLYFIGSIVFIASLRYSDLSLIYPIYALTFVWIALISFFVLSEPLTFFKSFGIILIISGVSILGVKG
jgi:multidrug transporter EmrE-like cation transporter